jgi:hypothetical protein
VRALRASHAALRPDGLLLDMYPAAGHGRVALYTRGRTLRIGQLDESAHEPKVANAQAAMRAVIDTGLFAVERETTFEFVYHFDTVDVWLEYMAAHWSAALVAEDLIARARKLLARGGGELRIRREIHAARLRRT